VTSFYNDNEPFAVEWLRNLIRNGVIDDGVVDGRSVTEISAADILGFQQCHFFSGIAGWSEAFRIAGLTGVDRVWSASLPCQPLSHAGQHKGAADERHLWPEFYPIVSEFRPSAIFGEQSASPDGREWLDGISLDLEELGYAVAAADLPASSVGAPHRRQRLFWVAWLADSGGSEFTEWCRTGSTGGMGHAARDNERRAESSGASSFEGIAAGRSSAGMGDAMFQGLEGFAGTGDRTDQQRRESQEQDRSTTEAGPWDDYQIAECADGKTRRVRTGLSPLAYGLPRKLGHFESGVRKLVKGARRNRKGRIKGYGNAIVPQVAAQFILAAKDAIAKNFDPK
jgi:DNA (cytosine-5)-methyltransferase 1